MMECIFLKVLSGLWLFVVVVLLFIVFCLKLVIVQCKVGVIGSFLVFNVCDEVGGVVMFEVWFKEIIEELDWYNQVNLDCLVVLFVVNQIVCRINEWLEWDLEICVCWKVFIWIMFMGVCVDVNEVVYLCGGIVLYDVINNIYV